MAIFEPKWNGNDNGAGQSLVAKSGVLAYSTGTAGACAMVYGYEKHELYATEGV